MVILLAGGLSGFQFFFTEGIVLQTIRVHLQAVNGVVSVWSFATCEDILILDAKNTSTGKSGESIRVVTLLHLSMVEIV